MFKVKKIKGTSYGSCEASTGTGLSAKKMLNAPLSVGLRRRGGILTPRVRVSVESIDLDFDLDIDLDPNLDVDPDFNLDADSRTWIRAI